MAGTGASWAGRRIGIGAALGRVSLALAVAFGGLAVGAGYWQVIESPTLSSSGDDGIPTATTLRGERRPQASTRSFAAAGPSGSARRS